jgi:formimidoylglutamate deiminase
VRVFAKRALLPQGWTSDVTLEIDAEGTIASIARDPAGLFTADERLGAIAPGMANLHSHAFQRAMAGRGERSSHADGDDFWTWREAMYALATTLDPDGLYRIALRTYRAMLRAGYTAVAEFHYIHRDPNGAWYADRCATSEALVAAAREAGIAICLLPALYAQSDPNGTALGERQKRFATTVDDVLAVAAEMRARYAGKHDVTVGTCAHSLRAVSLRQFGDLLAESPPLAPVHLHIAEQEREVAEVLAAHGARPIELLLRSFDVDERWCLVHATQATDAEIRAIAATGAIVGLCPTTEANLGDGIFPLASFLRYGGRFGIGSDSNVSISAVEELRLLEYGQRLFHKRRIVARVGDVSGADALYTASASDGAHACGFASGALAIGMRADLIELPQAEEGADASDDDRMNRYVFADLDGRPARTMVRGRWR